ncbi:unnamed protein product [Durusdinium trenchii]|uniref:Uncharacterized protein n=1 Tax=Durusdinium trenchii TaxID=1381693 RepID=A0ABP0K175_9DINO
MGAEASCVTECGGAKGRGDLPGHFVVHDTSVDHPKNLKNVCFVEQTRESTCAGSTSFRASRNNGRVIPREPPCKKEEAKDWETSWMSTSWNAHRNILCCPGPFSCADEAI